MAGLKQSEINHRLVWLLNICSHVHPFMDELVNIHSSKHIRQIQGEQHWLAAFFFFAKEILWLSFSLPTQPDHKILFLEQEIRGQTHLDGGFWKILTENHAWRFLIYGYCGMASNWSRVFLDDSSVVFGVYHSKLSPFM